MRKILLVSLLSAISAFNIGSLGCSSDHPIATAASRTEAVSSPSNVTAAPTTDISTQVPSAGGGVGIALPRPNTGDFALGRILVRFADPVSSAEQARIHQLAGGSPERVIPQINVEVVKVPQGGEQSAIAIYTQQPGVEFAEPDYVVRAQFLPQDPYYLPNQWSLQHIDMRKAWQVQRGKNSIRIAVLDTGIAGDHPDLKDKIAGGKNFVTPGSTQWKDGNGHGSHVAGVAAARTHNGIGIAGTGFFSHLLIGKVLDSTGSGYTSNVAEAVIWATDAGAKVINMSLGTYAKTTTFEAAINYAWNKGALPIAAAGNNSSSQLLYPAAYANCMAIAATDKRDRKATFSNFGNHIDIAAPGVEIFSTVNGTAATPEKYAYMQGTSMATPHVSGVAALVAAQFPGASPAFIRARLKQGVNPVSSSVPIGTGRLNGYLALTLP